MWRPAFFPRRRPVGASMTIPVAAQAQMHRTRYICLFANFPIGSTIAIRKLKFRAHGQLDALPYRAYSIRIGGLRFRSSEQVDDPDVPSLRSPRGTGHQRRREPECLVHAAAGRQGRSLPASQEERIAISWPNRHTGCKPAARVRRRRAGANLGREVTGFIPCVPRAPLALRDRRAPGEPESLGSAGLAGPPPRKFSTGARS